MKLSSPMSSTSRFEVVSVLGEGGMGVVYEVVDRRRNLRLALKTLRDAHPKELLRFKDEFRSIRDVRHPNLVRLGELVEDHGQWFFTMEVVDGSDFLTYVRPRGIRSNRAGSNRGGASGCSAANDDESASGGPHALTGQRTELTEELPWPQRDLIELRLRCADCAPARPQPPAFSERLLRQAMRGLASGLHALHQRGIVHRDIKPSNVLVTRGGRVVVLDFGIADCRRDARNRASMIVGTPAYMAPEQAMGTVVGPAADWYAVGVILFEALTGRSPYASRTVDELLANRLHAAIPDPARFTHNVPRDLADLCGALLAVEPSLRPSGERVLNALGVVDVAGDRAPVTPVVRARRVSSTSAAERPFLVGRSDELAELARAQWKARGGRAFAVVIEGESGVGKSTTVTEFLRKQEADEPEVMILRARCHERETVPYRAFDRIIDDLSRHLVAVDHDRARAIAPRWCHELVTVFPVLGQVAAFADAAQASPMDTRAGASEVRRRAFVALRELLTAIARSRPVIAVSDDLQWADADSVALLSEVMAEGTAPPLLLVATVRQPANAPACPAVAALGCEVHRIGLSDSPSGDARSLARAASPQDRASSTWLSAENETGARHSCPEFRP